MQRLILSELGEALGDSESASRLSEVQRAVQACQRCIVITGAGISVSSGIPDFRSPDGLFQQLKQKHPSSVSNGRDLFDATLFHDPGMVGLFYNFMGELRNLVSQAPCTRTHAFIKKMDDHGKLLRCYTQNIDSLEKRIGLETSFQRPAQESAGTVGGVQSRQLAGAVDESQSRQFASASDELQDRKPAGAADAPQNKQLADTTDGPHDKQLVDAPDEPQNKQSASTLDELQSKQPSDTGDSHTSSSNQAARRRRRQTTLDKRFTRAVQLHGDLDNVVCTICHTRYPFTRQLAEEFCEGTPPPCPRCKEVEIIRDIVGKRSLTTGVLRPDIVLYNEMHPQGELIGTLSEYDLRRRPDLLIVIGTSLKIPGIKRMIKEMSRCVHDSAQRTQRAGAGKVIFINRDEPPRGWEDVFDYYIAGDADQAIDLLPIRPPSFKDNNAANLQTDSSGESSNSEATLVAKSAVMDIGNLCNPLENKAAAGVEQQGRKRPGRGAKSLAAILPPGRKVGLSRKTVAPPVKPKGRKITSMMKVVKTTATKPKQAAPRRRSQRTCHQQVDMPASPPVPS